MNLTTNIKARKLIIATINGILVFFLSCFLFSFLKEWANTAGYAPLFIRDKEYFNFANVITYFFKFKFYCLIVALAHFITEMVLAKSLFYHFWRQFEKV
jgi:hypothetical protein